MANRLVSPIVWQRATVIETVRETPQARSLMLALPHWQRHRAGQHVEVRLTVEDGYQAQRSYSIASPPEAPYLMLTVERIAEGEVSPYLVDVVQEGDQLEVRGPIGGYFTWQASQSGPLLLVAGGSGIVPLMAMARHHALAGSTTPAHLLYSARQVDNIIYHAELEQLATEDQAFAVFYTLTRGAPPGWAGFQRRIDLDMLEDVGWPPAQHPLIYICGPTPLVEAVATMALHLGHAQGRIKTERFGPTGGS
ncbi:MAG: ferredoxin reductase [Chloroflexaceae bacterium]|jgi:ferredoxin-NADP reductase|nr:ferredoxin reductase [Chloroflexaceae bacterium]